MMFVSLFGHLLRNYLSLWGYVVVFQTAAMFRRPDMAKKSLTVDLCFIQDFTTLLLVLKLVSTTKNPMMHSDVQAL